jgi:hypothetical protein
MSVPTVERTVGKSITVERGGRRGGRVERYLAALKPTVRARYRVLKKQTIRFQPV